MSQPTYILLYVESPAKSAAFYADLLNLEPLEASPTFALFAVNPGLMLGLWSRRTVEPVVTAPAGEARSPFPSKTRRRCEQPMRAGAGSG